MVHLGRAQTCAIQLETALLFDGRWLQVKLRNVAHLKALAKRASGAWIPRWQRADTLQKKARISKPLAMLAVSIIINHLKTPVPTAEKFTPLPYLDRLGSDIRGDAFATGPIVADPDKTPQ